jgi:serine/threonine protein kinase
MLSDRDGVRYPFLCGSGFSRNNSKSVKWKGDQAYYSSEKLAGKMAGKKGDIYSLGLMFTEIALLIFGRPSFRDK